MPSSDASSLRREMLDLLASDPRGHLNPSVRDAFASRLREYASLGEVCDPSDVLFHIGRSVFDVDVQSAPAAGKAEEKKVEKKEDVIIPFDYMKAFMKDVFLSYGVTAENAETCSEVLIEADRRGIDSHGLGRLKPIYCDRMDAGILWPDRPVTIVEESAGTALVDGNMGLGLYVGPFAMNLALKKAKEVGVGFVAVKNSTHYGIAGYYATMATERGCVGMTGTNARPSIAPTFGVEPMLGTNPLCFGIPTTDPYPFVIDCATSVNQRGKIEKYARDGKDTPRGAVIDRDGVERTDTEGILRDMVLGKCALTPVGGAGDEMGGYKGYGWATTVELLCTAIQSGPWGEDVCGIDRATGEPKPMPLGHFFLAIDVGTMCDLPTFRKNATELLAGIRGSEKSPTGPGRIWTAGERENDARVERTAQGGMNVPQSLRDNMVNLRDQRPGLKEKYGTLVFES